MKDFDESLDDDIDLESYEHDETNWLGAKDAQGFTLIAMSCNPAKTKYGPKQFLHVVLEDDTEAVEYTVSFSEKSAAYAQLQRILDTRGADGFPFRCRIEGIGRTFKLVKAPPRPKGFKMPNAEPESRPVAPRPAVKRPKPAEDEEEVPF